MRLELEKEEGWWKICLQLVKYRKGLAGEGGRRCCRREVDREEMGLGKERREIKGLGYFCQLENVPQQTPSSPAFFT